MKFVTVEYRDEQLPGILVKGENKVVLLRDVLKYQYNDMNEFIMMHKQEELDFLKTIQNEEFPAPQISMDEVRVVAPITSSRHDIICVGVNYVDHLEETRERFYDGVFDTPDDTVYFSKRGTHIVGPEEEIDGHLDIDKELDYEVEVAIVVGKKIDSNTEYDDVGKAIFGYTIFNDISARKTQRKRNQWYLGKSFDGFSVMGPYIRSADMFRENPSLDIESRVNGETRQKSNTRLLRMKFSDLLYELSRCMTLEPGDIISTGTPSGVGMGFDPPRYLEAGDEVECIVEGLGVLRNTVR